MSPCFKFKSAFSWVEGEGGIYYCRRTGIKDRAHGERVEAVRRRKDSERRTRMRALEDDFQHSERKKCFKVFMVKKRASETQQQTMCRESTQLKKEQAKLNSKLCAVCQNIHS